MEVTFAWFWIIKLIWTAIVAFVWIKAYNRRFKNLVWNVLLAIVSILFVLSPIKINGTNSNSTIQQENNAIEMSKELPEKVQDNSFKNGNSEVKSITKKDIWK